jgi:hypothetical protein
MALDLKAWLLEQGVPAHKADDVMPLLAGTPFAENIDKSIGTIDRLTASATKLQEREAALTAAQTKLDQANERLNQEMVEWAEERAKGGVVTDQMRADMAKAQGEVTRLSAIVTSKATELGLDPKAILGEPPVVTPPARTDVTPPNLDGYAKTADINKQLGSYGRYLMTLPATLLRIQHEHQTLTGEWLDPEVIVREIETRGSDPRNINRDGSLVKPIDATAIWEEKFDIQAKRTAKAAADSKAHDDAIREEGRQEIRSQAALPGQQPQGRHSPVLRQAGDTAHAPRLQRPSSAASADRISKAASALATHRYRGVQTPLPAGAGQHG